jgi:carbonic anhydrase/acetyltransferase-like protein (isoleucine patch superfamily)
MSGLVLPFRGVMPTLAKDTFIAHTATVIGNTTIGSKSTVWYNTVLRGDVATITVGDNTNLQDGTIVHVTENQFDTHIGSNVVVGHRVILHGCTVEDWSFIAMDAVLLDGSYVETGAMVAAGALLTPGKRVPAGEIWAGRPAKFWRKVTPEERSHWAPLIKHYVDLGQEYMAEDAGRRIAAK